MKNGFYPAFSDKESGRKAIFSKSVFFKTIEEAQSFLDDEVTKMKRKDEPLVFHPYKPKVKDAPTNG